MPAVMASLAATDLVLAITTEGHHEQPDRARHHDEEREPEELRLGGGHERGQAAPEQEHHGEQRQAAAAPGEFGTGVRLPDVVLDVEVGARHRAANAASTAATTATITMPAPRISGRWERGSGSLRRIARSLARQSR